MFAGPNGSGKSTLIATILPQRLLGVYINPDEIEREIRQRGYLDLEVYGAKVTPQELESYFRESAFLQQAGLAAEISRIGFTAGRVNFGDVPINSYFASVAADFLRRQLLQDGESFTFETVMSSPDKIAFLETAREHGYRTYLYYVATEDPVINVSRVQNRIGLGGHPVPEDKIISRYERSLELLPKAIERTDRAYIFDNSGDEGAHTWIAEITGGTELEMKTDRIPRWFQRAVLHDMSPETP